MISDVDTSVLVAAVAQEVHTARVQAWLDQQDEAELAISNWVMTEFSAALSAKVRAGQIAPGQRGSAVRFLNRLRTESLRLLPVEERDFWKAADIADQHALGVRAGDASHLAICQNNGATLCTLDRRLATIGPEVDVPTLLL